MSPTIEVPCRVDYRSRNALTLHEHTSRLESLSATGCTILSRDVPQAETLELRIYLPDGHCPIRVDRAKVTWGHWNAFTVEFVSMPAADQRHLQDFLAVACEPVWT
jgi:hypothetical protein